MRYVSSQRISIATVILITLTMFACRKESILPTNQNISSNNLAFRSLTENKVRINQAVAVYDSSQIQMWDSVDLASPTPGNYYKWEVLPNSGCDSVIGDKGIAKLIFHCSGTYMLTAKIYDSLTRNLIGITDTLEINVTSDTLHPTQPIKEDDVLNIKTGLAKRYSDTSLNPDEVWVYLNLLSTEFYDNYSPYISFDYTTNLSPNNYNYKFSAIRLNSFPFAFGAYATTNKVDGWIDLKGLSYGVPANLNITWLGNTYRGTVTLLNENQYTFTWDNAGSVIVKKTGFQ